MVSTSRVVAVSNGINGRMDKLLTSVSTRDIEAFVKFNSLA